jgi:hypothetical protein
VRFAILSLMTDEAPTSVWLFHGVEANFTGAVFTSRERGEEWVAANKLTGMLTRYPVDTGVYDWAIARGLFTPKKDHERSVAFIGCFTSASQGHYHYEDGYSAGV